MIDRSKRYPVVVRLPETELLNLAGLKKLPVLGEGGAQVPLERVADITVADRIGTINREDTQRRVGILINVRGRDTEGFVLEAQAKIREQIKFPPGYFFEFGGQFENLQAARARLMIVVPAALALIFGLIYASFGSARRAELSKRGTAQLALKHPEVDMKAVQREMAELTSLTELRKKLRVRLRSGTAQPVARPSGKFEESTSAGAPVA